MLENRTTPDGFQVNENGAWVKDGEVQIQGRENAGDPGRYTVIGGPNRLVSPDGIQGIIPFDRNRYQEFQSGTAHIGTHIYHQNEYFAVPVEQYVYHGETLSLGAAQASGASAYRFAGKLIVDHTKPDAVNGKTNIRYRYDDGTFAGYGFHAISYSEEYLAENRTLRQNGDPNHLAYSGRGEHFFSEDGYMDPPVRRWGTMAAGLTGTMEFNRYRGKGENGLGGRAAKGTRFHPGPFCYEHLAPVIWALTCGI